MSESSIDVRRVVIGLLSPFYSPFLPCGCFFFFFFSSASSILTLFRFPPPPPLSFLSMQPFTSILTIVVFIVDELTITISPSFLSASRLFALPLCASLFACLLLCFVISSSAAQISPRIIASPPQYSRTTNETFEQKENLSSHLDLSEHSQNHHPAVSSQRLLLSPPARTQQVTRDRELSHYCPNSNIFSNFFL